MVWMVQVTWLVLTNPIYFSFAKICLWPWQRANSHYYLIFTHLKWLSFDEESTILLSTKYKQAFRCFRWPTVELQHCSLSQKILIGLTIFCCFSVAGQKCNFERLHCSNRNNKNNSCTKTFYSINLERQFSTTDVRGESIFQNNLFGKNINFYSRLEHFLAWIINTFLSLCVCPSLSLPFSL